MSSTIPKLHLKDVPTSPLVPLDVEQRDEAVEGEGYEVIFEGDVIGHIPASIAWRNRTLRWHDVVAIKEDRKRKREPELPSHEKSMILLDKMLSSTSRMSKPHYFGDPFPHGCDSTHELAMVGGDKFEWCVKLYNFWFNVPPIERFEREMRNFDPAKLNNDELKVVEQKLKNLWVEAHGTLMKRVSGR